MDIHLCRLLLATACSITPHANSHSALALRIKYLLEGKLAKQVAECDFIKEKNFDNRAFCGYLTKFGQNQRTPLTSRTGKYPHLLAIFCGFKDAHDFSRHPPDTKPEEVDKVLNDMFDFKQELPKAEPKPEVIAIAAAAPFVSTAYQMMDMEMGVLGKFEINCVTHSLYGAHKHISENIACIKGNENTYNYIVTERAGQVYESEFEELLSQHPDLEHRVNIKTLYNGQIHNNLDVLDIAFPLYGDIVIYRRYDEHQQKNIFHQALIVLPPDHSPDGRNFAIPIPGKRGNEIQAWFKGMWKKL